MNKILKGAMVSIASVFIAGSAFAGGHDSCGDITIAEMDWASAEFMANVDKIILEEGYGCNVELVPGATMTTFASMDTKGVPDVAPELWANAVQTPLAKAESEGRLFMLNGAPITGAGEGWMISTTAMEENGLTTLDDVLARPDLFPHPEDSSKGGIVTCPSGWGCQIATNQLFKAFDMEAKGWMLIDSGSSAGLDGSIQKAITRGENWFGYYWGPTVLAAQGGLSLLDMGPFGGNDNWDNCLMDPECQDPQPSGWVVSEVTSVVAANFIENGPKAGKAYIEKRSFPSDVMMEMLVWMAENQASGEDTAYEFLERHPDVWSQWVTPQGAALVKRAL